MSNLVKNIIRFILFILVQVYVLDKIPPLHRFITPYLYFIFILWLPFNMPRLTLTFVGFIYGLTLDYFTHTPGLHAAACTLVAYARPFVINILIARESTEFNYVEPSITAMGFTPYSVYILILAFLHNGYVVFLEWLRFPDIWYFIGKIFATTGISFLLALITEMLFYRKQRFRTNTA